MVIGDVASIKRLPEMNVILLFWPENTLKPPIGTSSAGPVLISLLELAKRFYNATILGIGERPKESF
jgi:hypothetical protein